MNTIEKLKELQALPIERKILISQTRIIEWYKKNEGMVYVSFSGGKDSTVLLHIVRQIYHNVPAVFCDTGLEFPGVKEHVRKQDNVTVIRPEITFRDTIRKYGWCFPGKDVANLIYNGRRGKKWALIMLSGKQSDGTRSVYRERYVKWQWLLNSSFTVSNRCCNEMKKKPFHRYEMKSGRSKFVGTMAEESSLRKNIWLKYGCNTFGKNGRSAPLSFWTEHDILQYISTNGLEIPREYGDIVKCGEMLALTGEKRTGCIFCTVGCHLDHGDRFRRLKKMYPRLYQYSMEVLGLREVLEEIGEEMKIDFFTEQLTLI